MNVLWIRGLGAVTILALALVSSVPARAETRILFPFDSDAGPFFLATDAGVGPVGIRDGAEDVRDGAGAASIEYAANEKWFLGADRFNDGPPGPFLKRLFGKDEPIPDGIDLSPMRALVVSVRSRRSMILQLSLSERDGSRYRVLVDLWPGAWRDLELPLDAFVLKDGTGDENDRLDADQIYLVAFTDFESLVFGKADANRFAVDRFGYRTDRPFDGSELEESGGVALRADGGRVVARGAPLDLSLRGSEGRRAAELRVSFVAEGGGAAVEAPPVALKARPAGEWPGVARAPDAVGRYLARATVLDAEGAELAAGESILAVVPEPPRASWIGACGFSEARYVTDAGADFTLADAIGLGWDRPIVYRDRIQPDDDEFDFEALDALVDERLAKGLRLSPVVGLGEGRAADEAPEDMASFERMAEELARRYRGRVDHWVVGNEPNLASHRLEPEVYALILERFARGARRGNPDVRIVMAGLAGVDLDYLEALYEAGAGAHLDVVNVHPYSFPAPPEAVGGSRLLELTLKGPASFERVRELRPLMERHGDGHKPVWLSEVAWGAGRADDDLEENLRYFQSSPLDQARYLVRGALLSRAWGTDKYAWLSLIDLPPEWAHLWPRAGLVDRQGVPRTALIAAAVLAEEVGSAAVAGPVPELPAGARGVRFEGADGQRVDALWSLSPLELRVSDLPAGTASLREMLGGSSTVGPELELELGPSPVYLRWRGAAPSFTRATAR